MVNNGFEKPEEVHPMIWITVEILGNQGQCTIEQQLENDINIIFQLDVHELNNSGEERDDFGFSHFGHVLGIVRQQRDEVRQEMVRGGRGGVRHEGLA